MEQSRVKIGLARTSANNRGVWGQVPRRSKHPLLTGRAHHELYVNFIYQYMYQLRCFLTSFQFHPILRIHANCKVIWDKICTYIHYPHCSDLNILNFHHLKCHQNVSKMFFCILVVYADKMNFNQAKLFYHVI
jgi:hypothetical protein